jgi:hypothetical protein
MFSKYIGHLIPPEDKEDDLSAIFLHQRCNCHIVNLIVKSGLKRLKHYLDDFRTAITFLNASNQCIAAFKSFCLSLGVPPRKFGVDMDVRWNSTYLMLKHLVPYRSTFSVFIQTNYPVKKDDSFLLTDDHWVVAEKVLSFLKLFYDTSVALSGIYYPTSTLMLHHILKIARHLTAFENDRLLRVAVIPMKTKFLKYWRNIPILYCFAFVLDPRAKMMGFNKLLVKLSGLTGTDYSRYPTSIRSKITKIFQIYEMKFGAALLSAHQHKSAGSAGNVSEAWDDIYEDDILPGRPAGTPVSVSSTVAAISELSSYLDSDTVTQFDSEFSVLNWWQRHKLTYPVLSILAKDVLIVPAFTVSSELTFSLAGRVLEDRRRRLTPDMVEVLSCIKDWELADMRSQHTVEKETKEFEATFEAMYLVDEDVNNNRDKEQQERGGGRSFLSRS